MDDIPILLKGIGGEPLGRLRLGARAIAAEAEEIARTRQLSKRTALPLVLREWLDGAGYAVSESGLADAAHALDAVRRGAALLAIEVVVQPHQRQHQHPRTLSPDHAPRHGQRSSMPMPTAHDALPAVNFFELERVYPNDEARAWYDRLVGLNEHKRRLLVELEMLLFPDRLVAWSKRHHGGRTLLLCQVYRGRVPLVILKGDVGTGKTALAETIGDPLARRMGADARVHLLKINTQVRGSGHVGEMSDLIVQAFVQAEQRAAALDGEPVLLLLDEADALATRRDTQQMHHEDKAGLNTVVQRLDILRLTRLPIAAIFITNRPDALDPAVRRRAALDLHFDRPSEEARAQMITSLLPELRPDRGGLDEIVRLTGEAEAKNNGVPFTASDITDRLLPNALRTAFIEDRALRIDDVIVQARHLEPTPPMGMV